MKEFIRQLRLWRIRRKITQAIRRIQQAQKLEGVKGGLWSCEDALRRTRKMHNP